MKRLAFGVDLQVLRAGDAGLAHAAGDDGRVGGHAAVAGDDALGLHEAVDVVGVGLPAHQDDLLALGAPLLGLVGVEDRLAHAGARRGAQAGGQDVELLPWDRGAGAAAGRAGRDRPA